MGKGDWGVDPQVLSVPPFTDPSGAGIFIGQSARDNTVYPELAALYAPSEVVAAIIMQSGRFDYVYLAYVEPLIGQGFWAVGGIDSVGLVEQEAFAVRPRAGPLLADPIQMFLSAKQFWTTSNGWDWQLDGVSMPRGFLGANATNNGTVCTTVGAAEIAVPSAQWDAEPGFELPDDRLFWWISQGFTIESSGAGSNASFLGVRKGQATIVGTALSYVELIDPPGYGGFTRSYAASGFFKNTSGALVSTNLSLTIQRAVGAGNCSLYGDNTGRLTLGVFDIGKASDNPNFAGILTSV